MEPFVLALGGRLVGLAGDRLHAQGADVNDQLADVPSPRRIQCESVVGQESLRNPVGGGRLVHQSDCVFHSLGGGDVGGQCVAGVVVDELEDHALTPTAEHVL